MDDFYKFLRIKLKHLNRAVSGQFGDEAIIGPMMIEIQAIEEYLDLVDGPPSDEQPEVRA